MDTTTRDLPPSLALDDDTLPVRPELALLVVHTPDARLRETELVRLDRVLVIGRLENETADLRVDDSRISRRHATLRPRPDGSGAELVDHDSRNGTYLDRQRTQTAFAGVGSVLRMGETIFVLALVPWRRPERHPAGIVGRSAWHLDALWVCENMAAGHLPVLLLGETGTGKDVFARFAHDASGCAGPLVTINCAAIPKELAESYLFGHKRGAFTGATSDRKGYFAQAEGGTIFLDEIGDLALDLQSKLLRVLENREYSPVGTTEVCRSNVGIVAATNVELGREVDAGRFRRDLYARVAGAVIRLPPLRARREDIPLLARRFLDELAPGEPRSLSAGVIELLVTLPWKMNVRELRMTMQRLVQTTRGVTELRSAHLVAILTDGVASEDSGAAAEVETRQDRSEPEPEPQGPPRAELVARLEEHRGNVSELAKHYGKDRKQVYRWLRRHNLKSEDFRRD